jgi:hypothetical protein
MNEQTFARFAFRAAACHVVTYMAAGLCALLLLDYVTHFQSDALSGLMRPVNSPWVAAGPGLQVIRGVVMAAVLFPFRRVILSEPHGWLKTWGLFLGLAIFSTAGPAPGSVEGLIYTQIPPRYQLMFLPEVVLQTGAFSVLLTAWYRRPHPAWNCVMGSAALLGVLMSAAGAFQAGR